MGEEQGDGDGENSEKFGRVKERAGDRRGMGDATKDGLELASIPERGLQATMCRRLRSRHRLATTEGKSQGIERLLQGAAWADGRLLAGMRRGESREQREANPEA